MVTCEEYNFYMRQLTGSNVICYFPQKSSKSWHENERSLKILTRILNIFKVFYLWQDPQELERSWRRSSRIFIDLWQDYQELQRSWRRSLRIFHRSVTRASRASKVLKKIFKDFFIDLWLAHQELQRSWKRSLRILEHFSKIFIRVESTWQYKSRMISFCSKW